MTENDITTSDEELLRGRLRRLHDSAEYGHTRMTSHPETCEPCIVAHTALDSLIERLRVAEEEVETISKNYDRNRAVWAQAQNELAIERDAARTAAGELEAVLQSIEPNLVLLCDPEIVSQGDPLAWADQALGEVEAALQRHIKERE